MPAQVEPTTVFDSALALASVFHMVEWVRWTVFLTAALVGVNLLPLFYVLSLNAVFGVVALVAAILAPLSDHGKACAAEDAQPERASFCRLQALCLAIYLPTAFIHILFMRLKGVGWCHEQYLAEEEDED